MSGAAQEPVAPRIQRVFPVLVALAAFIGNVIRSTASSTGSGTRSSS